MVMTFLLVLSKEMDKSGYSAMKETVLAFRHGYINITFHVHIRPNLPNSK